MARTLCQDCKKYHGMYMLKDEIWLQVIEKEIDKEIKTIQKKSKQKDLKKIISSLTPTQKANLLIKIKIIQTGFLCIECCRKRLGREFIKEDFTSAPVNDIIFHFINREEKKREHQSG